MYFDSKTLLSTLEELQLLKIFPSKQKKKNLKQLPLYTKTGTHLKYAKSGNSDSNTSEQTVSYIETLNPVTNKFFFDTDVTLHSSPDSTENTILLSAPSSENLITPTESVQVPPLSPVPVAPAISPANTFRLFHIPDPSDKDLPSFPLPTYPHTKTVAKNSKTFKHRKPFYFNFCDKPSPSAPQNKSDEPSTSVSPLDLKNAFDFSSETFSPL